MQIEKKTLFTPGNSRWIGTDQLEITDQGHRPMEVGEIVGVVSPNDEITLFEVLAVHGGEFQQLSLARLPVQPETMPPPDLTPGPARFVDGRPTSEPEGTAAGLEPDEPKQT